MFYVWFLIKKKNMSYSVTYTREHVGTIYSIVNFLLKLFHYIYYRYYIIGWSHNQSIKYIILSVISI